MPRQNRDRSVGGELNVARRVKLERERAGMTFESLAKRMNDAGCPIQLSALHRIEKGDPPRRITVDELIAFAQVFGLTIADFVRDPAGLLDQRLVAAADRLLVEEQRLDEAVRTYRAAEAAVERAAEAWREHRSGDLDPDAMRSALTGILDQTAAQETRDEIRRIHATADKRRQLIMGEK